MMQSAKRETISNQRVAVGLGVRNNVSGIKQFLVAQSAERTLPLIGIQDTFAKRPLMQSDADDRR